MKKRVTAIFDIGKTNKKFFLFNEEYQEVYRQYQHFDEITDEDGYPAENLQALEHWMKTLFNKIHKTNEYEISSLNFSAYGASFVHIDEMGKPLTHLYNYTKPIDESVIQSFYKKHGPVSELSRRTGSLNSGMLNSGMQLYWLKYSKPEVFKKIKYSLHLPQYLSYIFTGIPLSEYTSIGCHTILWDYEKKDYHQWVYSEGIHQIFSPIVSAETGIIMNYNGKKIKIGVGIHDSSAALLPYLRSVDETFILVSTGTWNIALNPFSNGLLSKDDIDKECINYMRIDGEPVKSSRIFLGNEYRLQTKKLTEQYGVPHGYHKNMMFDRNIYREINKNFQSLFLTKEVLKTEDDAICEIPYKSFEYAYHHLMMELVMLQVKSIEKVAGTHKIKKLFVDGGFTDNDVYLNLLSCYLKDMELSTTDATLGSALGAAISISDKNLSLTFLKKNHELKRIPSINT